MQNDCKETGYKKSRLFVKTGVSLTGGSLFEAAKKVCIFKKGQIALQPHIEKCVADSCIFIQDTPRETLPTCFPFGTRSLWHKTRSRLRQPGFVLLMKGAPLSVHQNISVWLYSSTMLQQCQGKSGFFAKIGKSNKKTHRKVEKAEL